MKARVNTREYIAEPEEIKEVAKDFAKEIKKELGILVKTVVLFGSYTKTRFTSGKKPLMGHDADKFRDNVLFSSDIDILIVFDDMINVLNPEVITAYRVVVENVASRISKRLHITTMQLTKFWDHCRKGDPIMINMLRDGIILEDSGTFGIAQKMMHSGEIKPSRETIWIYLANGPMSITTARWNIKQAVLDLYWSVLDAAHAALLKIDVTPDSPAQITELFETHIIKQKLMEKKYKSTLQEFYNLGKMVMRGELQKISGDHYDRYRYEAEDFVKAVKEMIYSK